MHRAILALPAIVLLAACQPAMNGARTAATPRADMPPAAPQAPPAPAPAQVVKAPAPPASARTAAALDTTTPEQKAAAARKPAADAERLLGETVASLGDATRPGLWIRTPLADAAGSGRVEDAASGKSAMVELIPLDGPDTAGSEISLAALRVLEIGLTDLPTLKVYAQ
ncbi:hypothetical protein [Profundibacterium mesophilum]|nr:hypothetical protein [Profundibacterium mesophilum]